MISKEDFINLEYENLKSSITSQYPEYSNLTTEQKLIVDAAWINIAKGVVGNLFDNLFGQSQFIYLDPIDYANIKQNKLVCLSYNEQVGSYSATDRVIGVCMQDAVENEYTKIQTNGICEILLKDSTVVALGDWLIPSDSNDGRIKSGAAKHEARPINCIGYALGAVNAGTDKKVKVFVDLNNYQVIL